MTVPVVHARADYWGVHHCCGIEPQGEYDVETSNDPTAVTCPGPSLRERRERHPLDEAFTPLPLGSVQIAQVGIV